MIQLNKLTIDNPVVLAPIAGYTDSPFRRIARRSGAGLVITELISAEGIVRDNNKTMDLLHFSPDERPLGIQIFGRDPVIMGEAAARVQSLGPDFIDLNMGCPSSNVCKGGIGSGAALLRDPDLVERIAAAVAVSVTLPVSVKIRTGWDQQSRNYRDVVTALESAGVDFITVHGRTRAQGYAGEADWDIIGEINAMTRMPVIGNGDIRTHSEALARLASSGCAAVMVGRGACGNPWIFSGTVPGIEDIKAQIREHLDMNISFYGDRGLILMRKHLSRYIHGFRNASQVRQGLVTAICREEIFRILDTVHE